MVLGSPQHVGSSRVHCTGRQTLNHCATREAPFRKELTCGCVVLCEMAGWHHWLDGCESQWTPGVGDGQGGLPCFDSWGCKESDTTELLIWSERLWETRMEGHDTVAFLLCQAHWRVTRKMICSFSHQKGSLMTSRNLSIWSEFGHYLIERLKRNLERKWEHSKGGGFFFLKRFEEPCLSWMACVEFNSAFLLSLLEPTSTCSVKLRVTLILDFMDRSATTFMTHYKQLLNEKKKPKLPLFNKTSLKLVICTLIWPMKNSTICFFLKSYSVFELSLTF